ARQGAAEAERMAGGMAVRASRHAARLRQLMEHVVGVKAMASAGFGRFADQLVTIEQRNMEETYGPEAVHAPTRNKLVRHLGAYASVDVQALTEQYFGRPEPTPVGAGAQADHAA